MISEDWLLQAARGSGRANEESQRTRNLPSHQLTWKCKKTLSKRKVVFLQGSVHFHVSWWEGSRWMFDVSMFEEKGTTYAEW